MLRNDDRDQPGLPSTVRAKILVVEDDAPNRQLLHDILQLRGHDVREAANVDEATRVLGAERIDLLLLDVNIPGGGAEAVIREVRRKLSAAIPIVAVTSLAMPGDRERLLGSGFHGYLSKPIDTRTFAATVEQFLRLPHLIADHAHRAD
ncbi:MAG TPA: response regulator [Polyangia bacterium]|jgi:two-component system cell cycle response regulator DivK